VQLDAKTKRHRGITASSSARSEKEKGSWSDPGSGSGCGVERFRIKVLDESENVVYDNQRVERMEPTGPDEAGRSIWRAMADPTGRP